MKIDLTPTEKEILLQWIEQLEREAERNANYFQDLFRLEKVALARKLRRALEK